VRGYRVRRARVPVDGQSTCSPDASNAPSDVWSYRFGPLQEREQKRQLFSSTDTTLAWVYTLVGADGKQLATYNGLQGALCGRDGVRLWPVEFNTYGPNNTRIITRADGTSEVVISDYLGSARVTLSTTAEPLQSSSYHPYGTERTSSGSGARTSYIGREHDKESDLGFYGVRLYEPEYGRFLSTDVLWGEFQNLTPYHYSENSPIVKNDPSGEFPWGVVIGAAVEIASQMIFENRSVSEIDGGRVAIAATAGGLTGGLSAFSSTATRVAGAAVISVAEGAGKRAVSGEESTVEKVARDAIVGGVAGVAAESIAKRALGSAEGQLAKDQLRRAENAVADGRPRPAQIARAEAAKEALGNVGRGPKQDAIISCAKEGSDKFLQVVTPVKRDNTSVTQRPIPLKP